MAKGYSLDALVLEKWSRYATPLGNGTDLDALSGVENAGIYMVASNTGASTIPSLPVKLAGVLEVLPWSGANNIQSVQRYTLYNTGEEYSRCQPGVAGSWTPWVLKVNANNIYNAIYPIGIVLQFDNATNPNNAFTGTVWEQILDGRAARAAFYATAGTTDGQIGSVGGSDSVSIAVDNLPSHTHNMRAHTHSIGAHTHTMAHTHSINHDHGAVNTNSTGAHTHSVSGSAASNGAHTHGVGENVTTNAGSGRTVNMSTGKINLYTGSSGAHSHSVSGTAASAGAHYHSVDLPNFTGTSGGSSAANTGGTALTTGGPSNNTSDATGGGSNLDVRNSSHYYAFWKRVA